MLENIQHYNPNHLKGFCFWADDESCFALHNIKRQVKNGIDVNAINAEGQTPITQVVQHVMNLDDSRYCGGEFIKNDHSEGIPYDDFDDYLKYSNNDDQVALWSNYAIQAIQYLLKQGANINLVGFEKDAPDNDKKYDYIGLNALQIAVSSRLLLLVEFLLKNGADPNYLPYFNTPQHFEALLCEFQTDGWCFKTKDETYHKIEKLLLAHGAKPFIGTVENDKFEIEYF